MPEPESKGGRATPSQADRQRQAKADADAKAAEEAAKAAQAAEAEAADAAEPEPQDDGEPRYSREDLLANARSLTGYGKYQLAAALSTLDGDEFTVSEAQQAAAGRKGQPVDPDQPENLTEQRSEQEEDES